MAFFKTIWKTNSKHKKLSEDLVLQNLKEGEPEPNELLDVENEVVSFKLKYLGSTVVEKVSGENISTEAVKNIVKTAKAGKGRKKLQRVNINISLKGIVVTDLQGTDILKISIYRISNCSTDPTHRQIFSFISTDSNETMECHAFVCSKRKMAETVTLAVAHAFGTAYEAWRVMPNTKELVKNTANSKENEKNKINQMEELDKENQKDQSAEEEKLIDFDSEPSVEDDIFQLDATECRQNVSTHWVCFDDDSGIETPSKTPYKVDLIFA